MLAIFLFLAAALAPLANAQPGANGAPYYTDASIANTAESIANYYSPNTFVTIYGLNLAIVTTSISDDDLAAGRLPIALEGSNVTVLINNVPVNLWYVSPTQINLLIPTELVAGPANLYVEVDGLAGPVIPITLSAASPSLFQLDAVTALATRPDGTTITASAPAQPGEVIVLYGSGMGPTIPPAVPNQVPQTAATLAVSGFQVLLNGVAVDPSQILYAGVTPEIRGLISDQPDSAGRHAAESAVQAGWPNLWSQARLILPVQ